MSEIWHPTPFSSKLSNLRRKGDEPQSAILWMGKAMETPVVRDHQIVIRWIMYLCPSYDHRIIMGGPGRLLSPDRQEDPGKSNAIAARHEEKFLTLDPTQKCGGRNRIW